MVTAHKYKTEKSTEISNCGHMVHWENSHGTRYVVKELKNRETMTVAASNKDGTGIQNDIITSYNNTQHFYCSLSIYIGLKHFTIK